MAKYENETQSMIENPPNLQCRNYPPAADSMIISLTDIRGTRRTRRTAAITTTALKSGCASPGRAWRRWAGKLALFGGRAADGAQGRLPRPAQRGHPFTHWRYIAVDSDRMLAQSPHWCSKAIRAALQTTWHGGVYLPPGDGTARAPRQSSTRCSIWSGAAETSCRSWKPICSCC